MEEDLVDYIYAEDGAMLVIGNVSDQDDLVDSYHDGYECMDVENPTSWSDY